MNKNMSRRDLERMLTQAGFELVRMRGSHFFYRHPDGATWTLRMACAGRDADPAQVRDVRKLVQRIMEAT